MRRSTFFTLIVFLLTLAALAAKSALILVPATGARTGQFDAIRAKARLAYILGDQRPHPADSPGDDVVRARLVRTLRQLGFEPIARDQRTCNGFRRGNLIACARVRNVIAALGPTSGKALLLSAHYDSVPVGPGASDDGIGVATLLEVGSILKQRSLKRRVLLLFDEGEELGLVGARAFLADPLSQDVDSLLNFEARGVAGPVTMFETNQPNGAAISAYSASVHRPFASSLSTDVARLIPNDTDVSVFKERGWVTLNSAIIGNETRYHSAGDDLASLDVRSLQDMGNEALALALKMSSGPSSRSANRIFLDIAERAFVDLPIELGLIWLFILVAAFGLMCVRSGLLLLRPLVVVAGAIVSSSALGWVATESMGSLHQGTYWRAYPAIAFFALYETIAAGQLIIFSMCARNFDSPRQHNAYWLIFLLTGALLSIWAPGAVIYFLAPPTIALVGTLLSRRHPAAMPVGALLSLLALYVTFGELLAALEEIFSPGPLWVVAPIGALLIAPVFIAASGALRRADRRITCLVALTAALCSWIAAGAVPAYSRERPQRFTIEHVTDFSRRRTSWSITNDGAPLPATYTRFGHWTRTKLDFSDRARWVAPAPLLGDASHPFLLARQVQRRAKLRTLELSIRTNGAERVTILVPAAADLRSGGLPGLQQVLGKRDATSNFTISCTGRSCDGMKIIVTLGGAQPVELTVVGARNGLPEAGAPLARARPLLATPQYIPDETITVSRVSV